MTVTFGNLGVWSQIDTMSAVEATKFAQQLEEWGYGSLWIPEAVGRDPFAIIGYLAAHTDKLVLATGIANIYARDPMAANAILKTLTEIAPDRFVLGLGVSHAPLVTDIRGHDYKKPVTSMRNYLEAMKASLYLGPEADSEPKFVLAALRKNMLKLAAEQANGVHPYFVPPEHTAKARKIIGPDAWLCPEQAILLEAEPEKARKVAREHMATYLALPNYCNNLRELGFSEQDLADGGSDKLVDAIVGWGDEEAIRKRIQEHWDAGADHVCIQALRTDGEQGSDMALLELLAPGLQT